MDASTVRARSSPPMKRCNYPYQVIKRWINWRHKGRIARLMIYIFATIILLGFTIHDMSQLIIQYKNNEPITNAEIASNQTLRFPPLTVCIEPMWSAKVFELQEMWKNVVHQSSQHVHAILNATPTDYMARWLTMFALEDLYDLDSAFIQGHQNNKSVFYLKRNDPIFYGLGVRSKKINELTLSEHTKVLQNITNSLMLYMCAVLDFSEDESFRFIYSINALRAIDLCADLLQQKLSYIITSKVFCLNIPLNFIEKEKNSASYGIGRERHDAYVEQLIQEKFPMSSVNVSVPTDDIRRPPSQKPHSDGARVYFGADSRHLVQLVDIQNEETALVTVLYDTWTSINIKIGSQFVMNSEKCADNSVSDTECDIICRARLTEKLCGCWPFSLRHLMPETIVKFCGVNDYRECVTTYNQRVHTCKDECNACTRNVYTTSMTTGKGNYGAGIQIICDTFTFPRFVQRPSFTPSSFLAQAGGIIGIYLGASWLSLVVVLIVGLKLAKSKVCCKSVEEQQQMLCLATLHWILNTVEGEKATLDNQNMTTNAA